MAIEAGANGIKVELTPGEIEDDYGLYMRGSDKRKVRISSRRRKGEESI